MKIGFSYNIKDSSTKGTDAHAEYETPETIEAIREVLRRSGDVVLLPCDRHFPARILAETPDIVFNIAEGYGGRDRESYVPVMCEMLGIPYTGSDGTTLGLTMDKALTKRLARDAGIRTTDFIVYNDPPVEPPPFGFPVFVKPLMDGSSRGISRESLVIDMESLVLRVGVINTEYGQPALVEPYLDGRDYCVGLLGNNPPEILPICEVLLGHEDSIPFFSFEYKRRDTDRLDFTPQTPGSMLHEMEIMARTIWDILGCRDYARMDFRTCPDGKPYLLEVNALPGLSPVSGIFVRQAAETSISFKALIEKIMERIRSW
ncbi:hypothetical protein LLG96_07275 [bacterium]|nr:hypothetical protein [bacterium]